MHIRIDNEYRMEFQTDLRPIIYAIKEHIEKLDWLISHHDFQYLNDIYDNRLNANESLIRISGKELSEVISKTKIQFIWGIFSGSRHLPKTENLDTEKLGLKNYDPDAYVYDDAEIEIDCFDSSFTIIRTENKQILDKLAEYFGEKINGS